jgi:hypothetical protein
MGRLILVLLGGAIAYYYLKQRKESIDKAMKFDREVAEVRREREEE